MYTSEHTDSLGERRVRVNFNTTGSTQVDIFKKDTAELINMLEEMRLPEPSKSGDVIKLPASSEKQRLISLAQTAYEEAAMWAVKAATL